MKRMISISTAALLLSAAVPAIAMVNSSAVTNRMSRRLLEEKVLSEQRVPEQAVKTSLILQERTVKTEDANAGFSNLSRARITTRNHTLRGARMQSLTSRPSRRSVIKDAESMLVLPPALVQTGNTEAAVTNTQKVTRRTLIKMTEDANRLGQ